jgi:hypothetical protein
MHSTIAIALPYSGTRTILLYYTISIFNADTIYIMTNIITNYRYDPKYNTSMIIRYVYYY